MKWYPLFFLLLTIAPNLINAQIKVLNDGNVGINCSTPLESLQIGDRWTFYNGSPKVIGYNFYYDGSYSKRILADEVGLLKFEANGDIKFSFAGYGSAGSTISSFTDGLVLKNSGRVTIGSLDNGRFTVSDNSNLTPITAYANHSVDWTYGLISLVNRVNTKAICVYYNSGDQFVVYGDGTTWTRDLIEYSDLTLKENIETINNPLEKVLQLNGVYFTYKITELAADADSNTVISDEPPHRQMGLIAQEVEEIVPEVVNTNENGLKGVSYQNLIALLIEAIKELEVQVSALENELNECCNSSDVNKKSSNIIESQSNLSGCYLLQNRPNPFDNETIIEYYIPLERANASMLFFDMNGKLLFSKDVDLNKGNLTINRGELMPGMYYYTLIVNDEEIDTKKMILTN
ncbi:MAG TPA: tail fiber domain-containing protein [Bacteroidales bacterium]|nr:tail fiber domain-containing protein [Bacteroidales bacterium]